MKKAIDDSTLGKLVFNEQLDWYETTLQTATDGEIELMISSDALGANDDLTAVREALPLILKALPDAKTFVAGDLLEIKNSDWLDEDQEPLSQDEFIQELEFESLSANAEQQWQVWFNASEVLFGHQILVWWSPTRGFYEAQTAG